MGALLLGVPAAAAAAGATGTAGLFGVGGTFAATQALLTSSLLSSSALSALSSASGLDAQAERAAAAGAQGELALETRRFSRFEDLRRRLADARVRFAAAGVDPNTGSPRVLEDAARRRRRRADRIDTTQTALSRAILRTNRRRFRAQRPFVLGVQGVNTLSDLLSVDRSF